MDITLYYTPHTRSLRPRWLLEELEVPYQLKYIDLFSGGGQTPEYKQIHPLGQVPALKIDGQIQLESAAMCHWLTDLHPTSNLAPPAGDPARALYEQWMFFAPGTLEPPAWLVLMHSMVLPEAQRVNDIIPWALGRHSANLNMLNTELSERKYLMDDHFTTADIIVGSTMMWLPDTLQDYPQLQAYTNLLKERPAYKRAVAK